MDKFQGGPRQLPHGEHCLRVVQAQRFVPLLIRSLAFGKRLVVGPAAFLKLLLKDSPLAVREVDPVFEALSHALSIPRPCLNSKSVLLELKPLKRMKPFYPGLKLLGFTGYNCKYFARAGQVWYHEQNNNPAT